MPHQLVCRLVPKLKVHADTDDVLVHFEEGAVLGLERKLTSIANDWIARPAARDPFSRTGRPTRKYN